MPWVKVDENFAEHPKHAAVGPVGWGVWLWGLAYCNRNLTDGFIPLAVAETIGGKWTVYEPTADGRERIRTIDLGDAMSGELMSTEWVIAQLVRVGLWEIVLGGYLVHDYPDYQPSKAEVLALRSVRAEAGRAGGQQAQRARHQASALASAQANAQAKFKPVPVPVPVADQKQTPLPPTGGDPALLARPGKNGHRKQPRVTPPASADARELHAYWQELMGFPDRALTADRLRHLHARLREGMTVAKGKRAIDGCRVSPWHMGNNPQATPYNEIESIFCNAARVDKMCMFAEAGGGVRASALSPEVEKLAAKFRPKER